MIDDEGDTAEKSVSPAKEPAKGSDETFHPFWSFVTGVLFGLIILKSYNCIFRRLPKSDPDNERQPAFQGEKDPAASRESKASPLPTSNSLDIVQALFFGCVVLGTWGTLMSSMTIAWTILG